MDDNKAEIKIDKYGIPVEKVFDSHARALACHCECLGMNAENSFAICLSKNIPYDNDSYIIAMQKWGLIDEKGNPTI